MRNIYYRCFAVLMMLSVFGIAYAPPAQASNKYLQLQKLVQSKQCQVKTAEIPRIMGHLSRASQLNALTVFPHKKHFKCTPRSLSGYQPVPESMIRKAAPKTSPGLIELIKAF